MDIDKRVKKMLNYFKGKNIKPGNFKNKQYIFNFLRDMGFSSSEIMFIYNLYSYNYDRDIDVDGILNPTEELDKFIYNLQEESESGRDDYIDNLFDEGTIQKYVGENFLKSNVEFDFDYNGLTLKLESDDWEEHFSGLSDDDMWVYNMINSYYIEPEEFDYDEFNYVVSNEETTYKLKEIAELYGLDDYPGKDKPIDNYEVSDFLQKYLPEKLYDEIVDDYLHDLGYQVARSRKNSAEEVYDDEVTYEHYSCDGYDYCIDIGYEEIIDFINEGKILNNLSELFDIQINGEINLYNSYYDQWLDDEGYDYVLEEFNDNLERSIEKLKEDEDFMDRLESIKKFNKIINDLKYYININTNYADRGKKYESKKIDDLYFFGDSINYDDETIDLYGIDENNKFKKEKVTFDQMPYFFTGMYLNI
jgi:hypothetical protein